MDIASMEIVKCSKLEMNMQSSSAGVSVGNGPFPSMNSGIKKKETDKRM